MQQPERQSLISSSSPEVELETGMKNNKCSSNIHSECSEVHRGEDKANGWFQWVKYSYSLFLLALCVMLITMGIYADETPVAQMFHPITAFVCMWLLILWLGILEGGQGCLVGLQPIDKSSFQQSHNMSYQACAMVHQGDNLNRFIVGRQFLVVLVVFCLNLCCTAFEDALVPGFPPILVEVILSSGLAVMLITVMLGQLSAEVNATECMLDFLNTPVVLVTTWICLAIEESGLLHATYVVPCIFNWFGAKPEHCCDAGNSKLQTEDARKNQTSYEQFLYWLRVAFSLSVLGSAMVATLSALLNDQTTMCRGMSDAMSLAILVFLIGFLGMLEAMQIGLFAVVNLPPQALEGHPVAQANCSFAFTGNNFQSFLIGRQICVTVSMFLLARITTTDVDVGQPTVLGMPIGLQEFFNTGLPGALITTIVASLAWRIIASTFPVAFMSNPLVYIIIRLCLALESSGVFSASWLLANMVKAAARLKPDHVYLPHIMGKSAHKSLQHDDDDDETVATASVHWSIMSDSSSEKSLNSPTFCDGKFYGST